MDGLESIAQQLPAPWATSDTEEQRCGPLFFLEIKKKSFQLGKLTALCILWTPVRGDNFHNNNQPSASRRGAGVWKGPQRSPTPNSLLMLLFWLQGAARGASCLWAPPGQGAPLLHTQHVPCGQPSLRCVFSFEPRCICLGNFFPRFVSCPCTQDLVACISASGSLWGAGRAAWELYGSGSCPLGRQL